MLSVSIDIDAYNRVALVAATKALLTAILFWIFLAHFTLVLDQFLARAPYAWRIVSLILPHSGFLYGLVAFTSRTSPGENARAY